MRMTALWWPLALLLALSGLACGGGDSGPSGGTTVPASHPDGGAGRRVCVDEDRDGFGRYCDEGPDCDDTDPMMTDECVRCREPNKGCPCEPGTMPMYCDPEDMKTVMNGVTGYIVCSQGTRYCRDGAFSDCEILFQYATFVPDK